MANLLVTERDFDLSLFEIQAEAEAVYQKWLVEFRGPRLAHVQAAHPAQLAVPQAGGPLSQMLPPDVNPMQPPAGAAPATPPRGY